MCRSVMAQPTFSRGALPSYEGSGVLMCEVTFYGAWEQFLPDAFLMPTMTHAVAARVKPRTK